MAVCTPTNAHMCRFLLSECMRPLLSQLLHWTHSADGTANTCLSMFLDARSPHRLDIHQAVGKDSNGMAHWPMHNIHLPLPTFLRSMHDVIFVTGLQMRYLAGLQPCVHTVQVLVDSALRQLQQVSSAVALSRHEPSSGLDSFTAASDIGSFGAQIGTYSWTTAIGWRWETVQRAQAIADAGALERQAAADAMLWDLDEMRKARGDAHVAACVASLQQRQEEAAAREQAQAQLAHEANMRCAAELQQQLLDIESQKAQRLVRCTFV
jgi:hypothetical protein